MFQEMASLFLVVAAGNDQNRGRANIPCGSRYGVCRGFTSVKRTSL